MTLIRQFDEYIKKKKSACYQFDCGACLLLGDTPLLCLAFLSMAYPSCLIMKGKLQALHITIGDRQKGAQWVRE